MLCGESRAQPWHTWVCTANFFVNTSIQLVSRGFQTCPDAMKFLGFDPDVDAVPASEHKPPPRTKLGTVNQGPPCPDPHIWCSTNVPDCSVTVSDAISQTSSVTKESSRMSKGDSTKPSDNSSKTARTTEASSVATDDTASFQQMGKRWLQLTKKTSNDPKAKPEAQC